MNTEIQPNTIMPPMIQITQLPLISAPLPLQCAPQMLSYLISWGVTSVQMVLSRLIDERLYPIEDHHRHTVTGKGNGVIAAGSISIGQGSTAVSDIDKKPLQSIGLVGGAGVLAALVVMRFV